MQDELKKTRKERFEQIFEILKVVATGAVVLSSFVAPNMARLLPALLPDEFRRNKNLPKPADISRALLKLKKKGLVRLARTPNGSALKLTSGGEELYNRLFLRNYNIPKPKRWDGKWRIVIFDVREENKPTRDLVRKRLKNLGFILLQDSVWLYPYDCEEIIELLKTAHRVRHDVHYLLVEKMAQDRKFRRYFNLE